MAIRWIVTNYLIFIVFIGTMVGLTIACTDYPPAGAVFTGLVIGFGLVLSDHSIMHRSISHALVNTVVIGLSATLLAYLTADLPFKLGGQPFQSPDLLVYPLERKLLLTLAGVGGSVLLYISFVVLVEIIWRCLQARKKHKTK